MNTFTHEKMKYLDNWKYINMYMRAIPRDKL